MSGSNELRTNRDLYLFVAEICRANAESDRTLEDYLKALWRLGSVERERGALPLARFAALLEEALRSEAPQCDPIWSRNYLRDMNGFSGYVHWEQTILRPDFLGHLRGVLGRWPTVRVGASCGRWSTAPGTRCTREVRAR